MGYLGYRFAYGRAAVLAASALESRAPLASDVTFPDPAAARNAWELSYKNASLFYGISQGPALGPLPDAPEQGAYRLLRDPALASAEGVDAEDGVLILVWAGLGGEYAVGLQDTVRAGGATHACRLSGLGVVRDGVMSLSGPEGDPVHLVFQGRDEVSVGPPSATARLCRSIRGNGADLEGAPGLTGSGFYERMRVR
jgi:hypothetical protein